LSDPNDPFRFEDVGGGINPFGESISDLRAEFERIKDVDIVKEFKSIRSEFTELTKTMDTASLPLKKVGDALGSSKTQKGIKESNKLFKTIKDGGSAIADILSGFLSAGSARDVFSQVATSWTSYLSDTFWGEILTGIDFEGLNTFFQEVLGPIFQKAGEILGTIVEAAPIGVQLGGAFGTLIGSFVGSPLIGGIIGTGIGLIFETINQLLRPLTEEQQTTAEAGINDWLLEKFGIDTFEEWETMPDWIKSQFEGGNPYAPPEGTSTTAVTSTALIDWSQLSAQLQAMYGDFDAFETEWNQTHDTSGDTGGGNTGGGGHGYQEYAEGGIALEPTQGTFGEKKPGEALIPLDRLSEFGMGNDEVVEKLDVLIRLQQEVNEQRGHWI